MAKFIILWYDYFGENHPPLMSNEMAAIPKIWTILPGQKSEPKNLKIKTFFNNNSPFVIKTKKQDHSHNVTKVWKGVDS